MYLNAKFIKAIDIEIPVLLLQLEKYLNVLKYFTRRSFLDDCKQIGIIIYRNKKFL